MDSQKYVALIGQWISPWKKIVMDSSCVCHGFSVYNIIQFFNFEKSNWTRQSLKNRSTRSSNLRKSDFFFWNDRYIQISSVLTRRTSIDLSKLQTLSAAEWGWKSFATKAFGSSIGGTQGVVELCGKFNFTKSIRSRHASHCCPHFWLFESDTGISLFNV